MKSKKQEKFMPNKAQIDEITKYIEARGRNGDTELAHLSVGEIILPKSVIAKLDPKILAEAFKAADRDLKRYTVGGKDDSFNPSTGLREYSDDGVGDGSGGWGGGFDSGTGVSADNIGGNSSSSTTDIGGGLSFSGGEPGGTSYSGSSTDRGGLGPDGNPGNDAIGGDGNEGGLSFGLADDGSGNSGPTSNYSGYSTDKGGMGLDTIDTVSYGGKDEGTRATESKGAAAPGQGPNATATVGTHGYGANTLAGGKMAGALGRAIGYQVDKAVENPAAAAINTAFGLIAGPLGLVNTISGLLDGPTVGGGLASAGKSVGQTVGIDTLTASLAAALGEFDNTTPNPTDPNMNNTSNGGESQTAQAVRIVEAATGQPATTIGVTGQGTIDMQSQERRRAFSRLTLGATAGNRATLLW